MSNFDRNVASARGYGADRAVVDAGLRAYMISVYNNMALGVALTGVAAMIAFQLAGGDELLARGMAGATPFGQFVLSSMGQIILLLGTFGLVMFISFRIQTLQAGTARMLFLLYAAALGVALTPIILVYTGTSIARVFFISAASFGALSLYGYTTQRDLGPIGSFLIMGVFGLILASLVNIFLQSSGMSFVISAIGVLIFAGLTAYDTQRIKEMYDVNDDGTVSGRKVVMGALTLYLDFINMFLMMLRLFGDRR
jgi:FtsH-binding integral membrane protein